MTPRTRETTQGSDIPKLFVTMHEYITEYQKQNGYPPSLREMAGLEEHNSDTYQNGFATSTSVIRYYYARMEKLNMVRIIPRISRGIQPIPRRKWTN